MLFVLDMALFVGGYVASIYTWQWVRTKWSGIETEIIKLEARAQALKEAITGK
jgi:hypothetical protein